MEYLHFLYSISYRRRRILALEIKNITRNWNKNFNLGKRSYNAFIKFYSIAKRLLEKVYQKPRTNNFKIKELNKQTNQNIDSQQEEINGVVVQI